MGCSVLVLPDRLFRARQPQSVLQVSHRHSPCQHWALSMRYGRAEWPLAGVSQRQLPHRGAWGAGRF